MVDSTLFSLATLNAHPAMNPDSVIQGDHWRIGLITGTTTDSNISAGFETRFLSERASPLTLIASATAEDSSLSVGKNRTAITSGTTTVFGSLIP